MANQFDVSLSTLASELRQWKALPPTAAAAVATFAAARAAAAQNAGAALVELRTAALRGDLDPKNVAAAVAETAAALATEDRLRSVVEDLDTPLAARFATSIRDEGPWILDRLRKHWDTAAADVTACVQLIPAEMTASDVLDYGSGPARDAWQKLGLAAQTLDILADLREKLRNRYSGWHHDGPAVAMFLHPETDPARLDLATRLYRGGRDSGVVLSTPLEPDRGGTWGRLVRAEFTLRLNSPAEAGALAAARPDPGYFRPTPAPLGAA
jgi:hypothetical protein